MQITIHAISQKMPAWVETGYQEYQKRLPKECGLNLIEIPMPKRFKGQDVNKLVQQEGEKLLTSIPSQNHIVALDVLGQQWDTLQLAQQMQQWQQSGRNVSLLIGGPEGLSEACLKKSHQTWSLSKLTFPHPVVRVILAEQIYRAWSILIKHPYHR